MTVGENSEQVRIVADPEEMHQLGLDLGGRLSAGDLVILTGPLGAGKTTLTRGIGEALGVRGPVTSPTFVIARTHPSLVDGPALVHVDAYRLGGPDELDDLDIDFDHSVVIVEWGADYARPGASWIELVIERPTGAGGALAGGGAADADADDADEGADESADESDADESDADECDADEDADAPIEARRVTLRGYGPRWIEGVL